MSGGLTLNDCEIIKEALNYAKQKAENYSGYPSYDFKSQRLNEIDSTRRKISILAKSLKPKAK